MKTFFGFMWSCIWGSCRFPLSKELVVGNPAKVEQSVIPWRASVVVLILGTGALVTGEMLKLASVEEIGRAMVYLPLGSMFGMGTQAYTTYKNGTNNGKRS